MAKKSKKKKEEREEEVLSFDSIYDGDDDSEADELSVKEVVVKLKDTFELNLEVLKTKGSDWMGEGLSNKTRSSLYELATALVEYSLSGARELYDIVGGRSEKETPLAHKWLKSLSEFSRIHIENIDKFLSIPSPEFDEEDIYSYTEFLSFRNDVVNEKVKLKKRHNILFNLDEDISSLPFKLHAKTPIIPLALRPIVEQKYPEMSDYVENRFKTK